MGVSLGVGDGSELADFDGDAVAVGLTLAGATVVVTGAEGVAAGVDGVAPPAEHEVRHSPTARAAKAIRDEVMRIHNRRAGVGAS